MNCDEPIETLQLRFGKNTNRHKGIEFSGISATALFLFATTVPIATMRPGVSGVR